MHLADQRREVHRPRRQGVRALQLRDRRSVLRRLSAARERRERPCPSIRVGDRDADPPLADVEPEETGHGAAETVADRPGVAGDALGRRDGAGWRDGDGSGGWLATGPVSVATVTDSRA